MCAASPPCNSTELTLQHLIESACMAKFGSHLLRRLYDFVEGDLILGLVFFELVVRSTNALYQGIIDNPDNKIVKELLSDVDSRTKYFRASNCNSIAAATGIPYATVYRKIRKLVTNGWLREDENGCLFLETLPARHFFALYQELRPLLLNTYDQIRQIESLPADFFSCKKTSD